MESETGIILYNMELPILSELIIIIRGHSLFEVDLAISITLWAIVR
jgi:hypothetical protein